MAIGDQSGRATLHLPPPQLDGTVETSASLEPDFKEVVASSFEVRTSTLDDAWRGRGEPAVTMVKVDVEGSEARVLRGAEAVISTCRPVLSIEVLRAEDTGPLEAARARHRYVDITLAPGRAVICPSVAVDPAAPNHLLVPEERLAVVVDELRQIDGVAVIGDRPIQDRPPADADRRVLELRSRYARSKRSRFMTLSHAATKSRTNFSLASSEA